MEILTLNVGGTNFQTSPLTIKRFPETRLGKLGPSDPRYNEEGKFYFYDRSPELFNYILDLYRNGSLHFPETICFASIRQELEYWEIPVHMISPCCMNTYYKYDNEMSLQKDIEGELAVNFLDYSKNELENNSFSRMKRQIWLFLDQPNSSKAAKIFNGIFLTLIVISYIAFALGTLDNCREKIISDEELMYLLNKSMQVPEALKRVDLKNPKLKMYVTSDLPMPLYVTDYTCRMFFGLEFILHFLFCPRKSKFFCSATNVLDLLLFIALGTTFIMEQNGHIILSSEATGIAYSILHSFTFLRIFRFLRLLKQCSGLRILIMALSSSAKPMLLLLISFLGTSIFFGNFMYYAELFVPDTFSNIFVGIWWAIITMTTVGYGDHYPKSPLGCIVGTICAMCGILILSMPVAMVASSFGEYFSKSKNREKLSKLQDKKQIVSSTLSKVWATKMSSNTHLTDTNKKNSSNFDKT